jgi:hypothetical protein
LIYILGGQRERQKAQGLLASITSHCKPGEESWKGAGGSDERKVISKQEGKAEAEMPWLAVLSEDWPVSSVSQRPVFFVMRVQG